MNVTKRITSLVLTLVMLFSLACTGVWTPHVHAEEPTALDDLKIVHVNPLYADTITEADLVKPNPNLLYGDNTDDTYYDTETAGEMIRDDLVARDTTIVVDIYGAYTSQETLQDDAVDMIYDVLSTAMVHTGNPTEQSLTLALTLGRALLGSEGAIRVHGGGFAGTVQAFVPTDLLPQFKEGMEAVFGAGSCLCLRFRTAGACILAGG